MVIKYPKYLSNIPNLSTFSNLRPSKICPNWDFWFGKITIWQPRSSANRGLIGVSQSRTKLFFKVDVFTGAPEPAAPFRTP
jgi:hypothetical protein